MIRTNQPGMCGGNCSKPITNFAPFICVICERWKMVLSHKVSRRTPSFADLILPDFSETDYTYVADLIRPREPHIVYVLPQEGHVLFFTPLKTLLSYV
jgi:hypothetical protein